MSMNILSANQIVNNKLIHGNEAVKFECHAPLPEGTHKCTRPSRPMMNELVQNPPAAGPCDVTALSQRRWMIESEIGPIVQLELMDDDVTALVYATTARDGSGPFRASFLTMLLLEDTVANIMLPLGVCSGEATVTVYRKIALHEATSASIYHEMMDFGPLAATVLAKRGIGLSEVMLHDDRDLV